MGERTTDEIKDDVTQDVALLARRDGVDPTCQWLERIVAELQAIDAEDDDDAGT